MNRPPATNRTRSAGIVLAFGLFVISVCGVILFVMTFWRPTVSDTPAPQAPVPLPAPESAYLNTSSAAQYVGSRRCDECHAEQLASYEKTAHSRSFSRVEPAREPLDGELDHVLSGSHFRAYRAAGELRHRESLRLADGEELELVDLPLSYVVGSGRYSRTYLAEVDGFLLESPLTWYAALDAWGMSPGYDRPSHHSFRRNIGFECLYCHSGRVEQEGRGVHRLRVQELAIGCERCHGPGSVHVARHAAGIPAPGSTRADGTDLSIVNPRRLPRDLAESVCQQCHLETASGALVRGRSKEQYRPGFAWTDFCVNYAFESSDDEMTVTGHVEQLRLSACYLADESLTCLSCHNPHETPEPAERLPYYRSACLKCHEADACGVARDERLRRNDNNCAGCHMPHSPTDVAHVAFTHHRIGIHTGQTAAVKVDEPDSLAPVLSVAHLPEIERRRLLALAYLRLFLEHEHDSRSKLYLLRANAAVQSAVADLPNDADLGAAQAIVAAALGEPQQAETAAVHALADDRLSAGYRAHLLGLLARSHIRQNRHTEASDLLLQATELRRDPGDWFLLALCRKANRDRSGAIAALEQSRKIDPRRFETYQMLAPLYRAQGDSANEKRCLEGAAKLQEYLSTLQDRKP